jgi:hypothetical protein
MQKGREKSIKPVHITPPILVILGGILILISGLYSYFAVLSYTSSLNFLNYIEFGMGKNFAPFTIILGLMLMGVGLLLFTSNKLWASMWSATALVFGILSIFNGGGFLLGIILVFAGSLLETFYINSP